MVISSAISRKIVQVKTKLEVYDSYTTARSARRTPLRRLCNYVRTLAILSLFVIAATFVRCESPQDNSGEIGALLGALVASGVVLLPPDRGQCNDGETTTEDGCTNQEGD